MLKLNKISYRYSESPNPVLDDFTFQFSKGWTGIIGANGSGKTTLLKIASGILQPGTGVVELSGTVYYCEQRTDDLPVKYEQFIQSYNKKAFKVQNLLGVDINWFSRWDTLSHGERKRCQIAEALFHEPDILAIDEPTNHIDAEAKQILIDALKTYNGIGLIVSHDRQLLNELCLTIISIGEKGYQFIRGNYDTYRDETRKQTKHLVSKKEKLNKEISKLDKEVKARKRKAAQSDKRVSKKNISSKDHDAKSKIDAARLTGKDAVDNKIYANLKSRMKKITSERDGIGSTAKREVGIKLNGSQYSKEVLLHQKEAVVNLGGGEILEHPDLYVRRNDKIGLTGNNGCGKSTLVNLLVKSLPENKMPFTYIPQEISANQSKLLLTDALNLNHDEKGKIFTIISRLNSDPTRILDSQLPSPGEVRKLMLAYAILKQSSFIIMDEPTNHMDLESITAVENALKNFTGALLLVSHDQVFLNNIVSIHWEIENKIEGEYALKIKSNGT